MNILATSGGFHRDKRGNLRVGALMNFAISLAAPSDRPKVCIVNTASGDDAAYYRMTYAAFAMDRPDAVVSELPLFNMPPVDDVAGLLLDQDVIWVGGGSVANLLAVWRVHDVDQIMRAAWEKGVVLAGVSAGSLCWHVGGTTDSFGPDLRPVTNGLALLPYSNTPHYDSEALRRPRYQELVGSGVLPAGWATDDGVGLHFSGTEFVEAVSERDDVFAWKVERSADGNVTETKVTPRRL